MKVTQEKLPQSQLGLEIEIPAETTKQAYEKVIQNLARSANIPGFRKGKVPRQILLQRIGPQRIKEAALEDLVQESLKRAIEQESVDALGNYQLVSTYEELIAQFRPGEPLTFSASVDVPPEVHLGDYSNLSVKAEETKPNPEDVDEFLEERRAEQATLIPVESRPAQMGDIVVVDYVGRLATEEEGETGEEIPNGNASDFQLELEDGKFIQDLIEGIVGMSPGESKEVPVRFPEDYPREDLAGQSAIFSVTLKELKEKELPELDDDLAQEVSEFETLAELRENLSQQFSEKAERETQDSKEQALIEALLSKTEVELPETLVRQEVDTLLRQTLMQLSQMGMDLSKMITSEMVEQMRQRSRPEAIERLRQSLALKEVAKRESLSADPEAIEAKVKELMEQLAAEEVDPQRVRTVVESDLLNEKTLQWLEEHATIELVPQGSLTPPETPIEPEAASEESEAVIEAEVEEVVAASEVPPEASAESASSSET